MKNVHTEHCCIIDGCKYGDLDCPVFLGVQVQSYPCDSCYEAFPFHHPGDQVEKPTIDQLSDEEFNRRMTLAKDSYPDL